MLLRAADKSVRPDGSPTPQTRRRICARFWELDWCPVALLRLPETENLGLQVPVKFLRLGLSFSFYLSIIDKQVCGTGSLRLTQMMATSSQTNRRCEVYFLFSIAFPSSLAFRRSLASAVAGWGLARCHTSLAKPGFPCF